MKLVMANKFHRPQGGCETVYFSEIKGLRDAGHEVAEFAMFEENSLPSEYTSYFAREVNYNNLSISQKLRAAANTIYNFSANHQISRLISDFKPALLHAHNIYHQISPSIFDVAQKSGIPSILTSHDLKLACPNYKMYVNDNLCEKCLGGAYWNCIINRCSKGSLIASTLNTVEAYTHKALGIYKKIDRIICPSHFNANMLIRAGFSEKKISILPNGVPLRENSDLAPKEGYLLYIGRITKDKGISTILDAAKSMPEIEFKIAGDGPDRLAFEEYSSGIKNVHFLGFKNRKEIDELILRSNGVIVSSLLYENCPMSVLEAMSMGKVVIASRIGGIPEIIDDGVNGFLYENTSAKSLQTSIRSLLSGGSSINNIEEKARQTIASKYSEEAHLSGLLTIYKELA